MENGTKSVEPNVEMHVESEAPKKKGVTVDMKFVKNAFVGMANALTPAQQQERNKVAAESQARSIASATAQREKAEAKRLRKRTRNLQLAGDNVVSRPKAEEPKVEPEEIKEPAA